MTIPQTPAAPMRQQRWIEILNVGGATIPPFGACEVTDSYRPEQGSLYTPSDGRTVIKARMSTIDEPCLSIINGPCEIPAYEFGRVGTIDSPMLAMVASDYPANTDVGIKAGSFALTEGICGYRVVGDYDAGTGTQRVIKTDDCQAGPLTVRAIDCILPGEGGQVKPQAWNATTGCWEDAALDPIDIVDPQGWLLAVPGDCFKVDRQHRCGQANSGVYMPSFPFGMTQIVRVLEQIDCGQCGEVTIVRKAADTGSDSAETGHCGTEATECTFQACNMSYRPISCDAHEYAIAHIIPGECCLPSFSSGEDRCIAFLMPYPRPMFAKGTLIDKLCGGQADLTDAGPLDVCEEWGANGGSEITSASNPLGLHACVNTDVLLMWCTNCGDGEESQQCAWMVIGVEDVELPDYVIDLRCDTTEEAEPTCAVDKEYKLQKRYGHFCECEDDESDWVSTQLGFNNMQVVEEIEAFADEEGRTVLTEAGCGEGDTSCSLVFGKAGMSTYLLKKTVRSICVLCPKSDSGAESTLGTFATLGSEGEADTITGTEMDVLTDIAVETEVTSDGGGDEVDCDTALGLGLVVKGKTKKICIFCGGDGAGTFEDGDEVTFPLPLQLVEAVTEADFYCDPCVGMDVKTTQFYALCVGDESTATSVVCDCYECPPESSS